MVQAPADTFVSLTDMALLADARIDHCAGWLGASERQRYGCFVQSERRRQFVVGRALLRIALAPLLGTEAGDVLLQEQPGRAPALVHSLGTGIGLSISHSGRWVGCAVSTVSAVGLDVERVDPARDVLALARQALPPEDLARLHACSLAQRAVVFHRMWCRHEARIKLGTACAAEHVFEHAGLAGALCLARAAVVAPMPLIVDLG